MFKIVEKVIFVKKKVLVVDELSEIFEYWWCNIM